MEADPACTACKGRTRRVDKEILKNIFEFTKIMRTILDGPTKWKAWSVEIESIVRILHPKMTIDNLPSWGWNTQSRVMLLIKSRIAISLLEEVLDINNPRALLQHFKAKFSPNRMMTAVDTAEKYHSFRWEEGEGIDACILRLDTLTSEYNEAHGVSLKSVMKMTHFIQVISHRAQFCANNLLAYCRRNGGANAEEMYEEVKNMARTELRDFKKKQSIKPNSLKYAE